MKLRDERGSASHIVLEHLFSIQSYCRDFLEYVQKSPGINVEDSYFQETYATYGGTFILSTGLQSDPIKITANVVGSASNDYITGTGVATVASLVTALTEDYTIVGDGTQILKNGEILSIIGGKDKADEQAEQIIKQKRFAVLIEAKAQEILDYYNGL